MVRADGGGSIEVRLEEEPAEPDDVPHATGGATRHPPATARGRRPRARAAATAGVLALLAVLVGLDVRADRREERALRAVADVPGVVAPMPDPVREAWRLSAAGGTWTVGGVLVQAQATAGLVGRDLATGAVRWTVPLLAGTDVRTVTCPYVVPRDGAGLALCTGLSGPGDATDRRGWGLDLVDLRDGRLLGRPPSTGVLFTAGAVDGDLVTVELSGGVVVVSRHDVRRGVLRWRTELAGREVEFLQARVTGDQDVVAVEGTTLAVLTARDGRELGRWVGGPVGVEGPTTRVVAHRGTGFGVWERRSTGRWYRPDGTPGPRLDGEVVDVEVDDGSAPRIVLLRPPDAEVLRAVDVSSGEEVWRTQAPERVLLRLDGRLVVLRERSVDAVDVATGERLWSVTLGPDESPALGGPLTDGLRLLLRATDDDGGRLTAHRLTDGRRLWQAPLPRGSAYVTVLGNRLAVVGEVSGSGAATVLVLR